MKMRIAGWLVVLGSVGAVGMAASPANERPEYSGVVVEEVGKGSALEKAGLRPGDVVYSWTRLAHPPANPDPASGEILSPFDWMWLQLEQAQRGPVQLTGQRHGEFMVFEVGPGKWKIKVRARMPEGMLENYTKGKKLVETEELAAGIDLWHKVVETGEIEEVDWRLLCWLHLRIGDAWSKARNWEKAHTAFRLALETAQDPLSRVEVLQAIGHAHREANEIEAARESFGSAQEIRERVWGKGLSFAWGLNDLGILDWRQSRLDSAQDYWQRALDIRRELAPGSADVAGSLNNLGSLAYSRGDLARAAEYFEASLEIRRALVPHSLDVARNLNNLGNVISRRGNLTRAGDFLEEALEIFQALAPGSLDVATCLDSLGNLADERGDLVRADGYYGEALKIIEALAPGSLALANSQNNLGVVAHRRGDLARAAKYHEMALEIRRTLAPDSLDVADSLGNLGNVAYSRGDLVRAFAYFEESLQIQQKLAPDSLSVANTLQNLGSLAAQRGAWDRATRYFKESSTIKQRLAPNSLNVASTLTNLGVVATQRGAWDQATEYFEESMKIRQRLAPGSLDVASTLDDLGISAFKQGDLVRAAEYHEASLEIRQKLAPGSLDEASSLLNLGIVAHERGDLARAAEYLQKSLKIQQRLSPGSSEEAAILHALATVGRKQNQLRPALILFYQALHALESQVDRLGGSHDIRAGFRAERMEYYRDTIDLLLDLQQQEDAFNVLERSRARSFLNQVAERDLVFSEIPKELEQERRRIAWSYNQAQNKIATLNPREQAEEIEASFTRLRQLHWDYEDVTEKIVSASPKLGALRYPHSLDLNEASQALDPGTVMLSYAVGKEETHLFVVTREDQLQVKTLPLGEGELRRDVEYVHMLQERRSAALLYAKPLRQTGERLYKALISPAEESIAKSERVLIVPDGPLHLLPFALLVRKTEPSEDHQNRDFEYLVEWRPLHSVLSATVYAELKNQRRSQTDKATGVLALAAFGDPQYSPERTGGDLIADRSVDVYVRAAAERGFDNRPLPYSREEVNRIVALYPDGAARAFLGVEASEERAKSVGKSTRILHFATHGHFDDLIPLNSYLALTTPKEFRTDQDNGLLQAWEIFEDVRLDADLVVLSACESGLGYEVDGEGLKGLTRAFQFAGARTVVSSLWKVADRATGELMVRFYRHLRGGMSKDEALRAAQIELIQGPVELRSEQGQVEERDFSMPYYWASFQVIGDWR